MNLIKFPDRIICFPDGRKAGRLCRHDINANPKICGERCDAGSDKLHHFIFHIAVLKYGADNSKRHILRSHALLRRTFEIDCHNTRHIDVIRLVQKLLHQLWSALAHRHRAQRAIARMRVRTQNHPAAACEHFPRILVNDCLMRRYIDTAVFLGAGQSKHVIVLIDGAAHRTERVMAVGQHIRHRELCQP